jgi:hypothetical protein
VFWLEQAVFELRLLLLVVGGNPSLDVCRFRLCSWLLLCVLRLLPVVIWEVVLRCADAMDGLCVAMMCELFVISRVKRSSDTAYLWLCGRPLREANGCIRTRVERKNWLDVID